MIAVIGAAGRAGSALCRSLREHGRPFLPVVRNAAHWIFTSITTEAVFADLEDGLALRRVLAGATIVVSCAPAAFTAQVLACAPATARFLLLGCPQDDASAAAFLASGRAGVMLRTTIPYGTAGDAVQGLAAALKRRPVVTLPEGGLVQPIHIQDLLACLNAALGSIGDAPEVIVVAGPEAMPVAGFIAALAHESGFAAPSLTPGLLDRLPFRPRLGTAEIGALMQDRPVDTAAMRARLGVAPRPFAGSLPRA